MTIRYTRDQLIDVIGERRPLAERFDKERLAAHEKAERAFLASFKTACREAAKWDYEMARDNAFRLKFDNYRRPKCPSSLVAKLDSALGVVAISRQRYFTVNPTGQWADLWYALTYDPSVQPEMC